MDKKNEYLHAKIQIGNSKGPITYKLKQTVFHHDDIPDDKRKRHGEIKNWLKSKILTEETPQWNKSSYVFVPECERRTMENHVNDRSNAFQYNYRSESLECLKNVEPIDKPTKMHVSTQYESTAQSILDRKASSRFLSGNFNRTGEMPSHPNLTDAEKWNVSTFVEPKQINQQLDDMTKRAQEWSAQVTNSEQLLKKRVSLIKSTKLIQEEVRKQKAEGTFSSTKLVHRPRTAPVDRKKLKNRFPNEKLNKMSTHQHSGVWEMNKLEGRLVDVCMM